MQYVFSAASSPKVHHFSIFLHNNISKMHIFRAPSSTLGGVRQMRLQTFLYKIPLRTTFIKLFWCEVYFWQRLSINAKIRAFFTNHNVNSSANDRGTIFGIMHEGEPLD